MKKPTIEVPKKYIFYTFSQVHQIRMLSRQLHQVQQFHDQHLQSHQQLQNHSQLHTVELLESSSETELPKYEDIFPKTTSDEPKEAPGIPFTKLLYNFLHTHRSHVSRINNFRESQFLSFFIISGIFFCL